MITFIYLVSLVCKYVEYKMHFSFYYFEGKRLHTCFAELAVGKRGEVFM